MPRHQTRRVVLVLLSALTVGVQTASQTDEPLRPDEAEELERKLTQIFDNTYPDTRGATRVTLYQREINAYFAFQGASELPTGVTEPQVTLGDGGLVSMRATVDLGAVGADKPRGALDPLRYLAGMLPVAASGFLRTDDGIGRVEIESVVVGGIPVPVGVLHELVQHFSRNETNPNGFDLAAPFELPYGVSEVYIEQAQAVVVQ